MQDCSFENFYSPDKACHVPLNLFGPCGQNSKFGFTGFKPCIFLEFNPILAWTPEFYEPTDVLPDDMPESLQRSIKWSTRYKFSVR